MSGAAWLCLCGSWYSCSGAVQVYLQGLNLSYYTFFEHNFTPPELAQSIPMQAMLPTAATHTSALAARCQQPTLPHGLAPRLTTAPRAQQLHKETSLTKVSKRGRK